MTCHRGQVPDGGAVPARGGARAPPPGFAGTGGRRPAAFPAFRLGHGLRRGLGPLRRSAGPGPRPLHRSVPRIRCPCERDGVRRSSGGGHRAARQGMDPCAGHRLLPRQHGDWRGRHRGAGRWPDCAAGPGACLQGRRTQDPGVAPPSPGRAGPRFDIRAFHAEVVERGSLPLAVLEARIDRWIAAQK